MYYGDYGCQVNYSYKCLTNKKISTHEYKC